jgi:hypothetical protein
LQYGWPMRFVLEAYMELCIASIIKFDGYRYEEHPYPNQWNYSFATAADSFDAFLGVFYLILIAVAPIWAAIFFSCNIENIKDENDLPNLKQKTFMMKFGTYFEATKIDKMKNIHFNTIFLIRRLGFVLTCVYL